LAVAGPVTAQTRASDTRATIQIEARVVRGLDSGTGTGAVTGTAATLAPALVVQQGTTRAVDVTGLDDLRAQIDAISRQNPDVLVMMMVVGPDGEVVEQMTSLTDLPE